MVILFEEDGVGELIDGERTGEPFVGEGASLLTLREELGAVGEAVLGPLNSRPKALLHMSAYALPRGSNSAHTPANALARHGPAAAWPYLPNAPLSSAIDRPASSRCAQLLSLHPPDLSLRLTGCDCSSGRATWTMQRERTSR